MDDTTRLRILWVKTGGLWPHNTGGRLRSFHIISELARQHRVSVMTTHAPDEDPEGLRRSLLHCHEVVSIPHAPIKWQSARFAALLARSYLSPLPVDAWRCLVPRLRDEVAQRLKSGEIDVCVADFIYSIPNVPLDMHVPVVKFSHNCEHMIWQRMASVERRPWRRALLAFEAERMRRYEADACTRSDLTIAVSEADREVLACIAPQATVVDVPTGVDIDYFTPATGAELPEQIVFTGSMDWHPNEDAMLHFIESVLPLIRVDVPQVSLTIVGRNPTPKLRRAARIAGVGVTGTVDDVRPYMAKAAVFVVPLRVGGGTRLKIFEALAMGKAVVSTSIGAEGLPLANGTHFMQADEPATFAAAVVALLRDRARRRALGDAGRQLVVDRFSWPQVARIFGARCAQTVYRHAA